MLTLWTGTNLSNLPYIFLSGIGIYSFIILYTRLTGLRSFSKMSAADFAMTVAVGSMFATVISSPSPTLIDGAIALAFLFLAQFIVAILRRKSKLFCGLVDNQPLLLVQQGQFIEANMRKSNVSKNDVYAKLREANAYNMNKVHAVIFESTGDISVLHGEEPLSENPDVLQGVVI